MEPLKIFKRVLASKRHMIGIIEFPLDEYIRFGVQKEQVSLNFLFLGSKEENLQHFKMFLLPPKNY